MQFIKANTYTLNYTDKTFHKNFVRSRKGTNCHKAAVDGHRVGSCKRGSRSHLRKERTARSSIQRHSNTTSKNVSFPGTLAGSTSSVLRVRGDGSYHLPPPTCLASPEDSPPWLTHSRCTRGLTGRESADILRLNGFKVQKSSTSDYPKR